MDWDKWPELRDFVRQEQEQKQGEIRRAAEERQGAAERKAQEATLEEARKRKLVESFNGFFGQYRNSVPELLQMLGVAQWGEGNFRQSLCPDLTMAISKGVEAGCTWTVWCLSTSGERYGFSVKLSVWEESGSTQSGFKVNRGDEVLATEDALKKALLEAYKRGPVSVVVSLETTTTRIEYSDDSHMIDALRGRGGLAF